MTVFSTRRLAVFVLLAVFVFTLSGCWNPFAPDEGDKVPTPPPEYRDRTSPENVIHNLKTAYEYKSADNYLDCMSEDFIFYPSDDDQADPQNPLPDKWYKSDEQEMHDNMFTGPNAVESITLTLTNIAEDLYMGEDPDDPADDFYIRVEDVDLTVITQGDDGFYANANSEYRFRIDIDQSGENGEVWWEIYEWFDLDSAPGSRGDDARQDPKIERISLGELKYMFR
jgi:hypothetical protein